MFFEGSENECKYRLFHLRAPNLLFANLKAKNPTPKKMIKMIFKDINYDFLFSIYPLNRTTNTPLQGKWCSWSKMNFFNRNCFV